MTAISRRGRATAGRGRRHLYNVRDSSGKFVLTSSWNKDNATKECHPELFPEPKAAAPEPAPAPKAVIAPVEVAPTPRVMVFEAAALFAVNKAELSAEGKQIIKE